MVKNLPVSGGDAGDMGLTPGSGRSSGGGHATHFSIHAWRIPWTEETEGLQSLGLPRVGHARSDLACTHFRISLSVFTKILGILIQIPL